MHPGICHSLEFHNIHHHSYFNNRRGGGAGWIHKVPTTLTDQTNTYASVSSKLTFSIADDVACYPAATASVGPMAFQNGFYSPGVACPAGHTVACYAVGPSAVNALPPAGILAPIVTSDRAPQVFSFMVPPTQPQAFHIVWLPTFSSQRGGDVTIWYPYLCRFRSYLHE